VHTSYDDDSLPPDAIVQPVRKALYENAPCVSMNDRIGFGLLDNGRRCPLHGCKKLITEAGPLLLIPLISSLDVGSSGGAESDLAHRFRA